MHDFIVVSNINDDMILGTDLLNKMNTNIKFENSKIILEMKKNTEQKDGNLDGVNVERTNEHIGDSNRSEVKQCKKYERNERMNERMIRLENLERNEIEIEKDLDAIFDKLERRRKSIENVVKRDRIRDQEMTKRYADMERDLNRLFEKCREKDRKIEKLEERDRKRDEEMSQEITRLRDGMWEMSDYFEDYGNTNAKMTTILITT